MMPEFLHQAPVMKATRSALDAVIRSRDLLIFSGAARTPARCWSLASSAVKHSIDGASCWTASSECRQRRLEVAPSIAFAIKRGAYLAGQRKKAPPERG